jgi:hypothetical protein
VFNEADVCPQWTPSAFLLECGYPRIAIQLRHLARVIPPGFPLGKLRQEFASFGIQQQGLCDNVDERSRPCYRQSENR